MGEVVLQVELQLEELAEVMPQQQQNQRRKKKKRKNLVLQLEVSSVDQIPLKMTAVKKNPVKCISSTNYLILHLFTCSVFFNFDELAKEFFLYPILLFLFSIGQDSSLA